MVTRVDPRSGVGQQRVGGDLSDDRTAEGLTE